MVPSILLLILIVMDVALIGAIVFLFRKNNQTTASINELTEERRYLTEIRSTIKEELENIHGECKEILKKTSHLALEVEQEVKNNAKSLTKEIDQIISQMAAKVENPMQELTKQSAQVEALLKKVKLERVVLKKSLNQGENLLKILKGQVPYEQVVKDLEERKYRDARYLLAKGQSPEKVALELNLGISEVELLASAT